MISPIRHRGRLAAVVGLGWLVCLNVLLGGAVAAASSETLADNFDAVSYSGSNGSLPWSGDWIETGESDGPTTGRVRVVAEAACAAGGCGLLAAGGNTAAALQRQADLGGAADATLSYSYRRTRGGGAAGQVRVSVSGNGGASWTTLATYSLDTSDGSQVAQSFNVTGNAFGSTRVRFSIDSVPGESGRFHLDNVRLAVTFPDPTTTTTTSTTTSTTSSTTTTTTTSPSSTTTTTTGPIPTSSTTSRPPTTLTPPGSTSLPPTPSTTTTTPEPPTTTTSPPDGEVVTAPPQRPEPPIPVVVGTPVLRPATMAAVTEAAVANHDVSNLVVRGIRLPVAVEPGVQPRPGGSVGDAARGGFRYTLPALAPGLLIGYSVLTRRPRLVRSGGS